MSSQSTTFRSPAVPWLRTPTGSSRTAGRAPVLYVADDHGLGVEVDPGVLDCRSLIAEALAFKTRRLPSAG